MKANTDESHFLLPGNNNLTANVNGNVTDQKGIRFYLI